VRRGAIFALAACLLERLYEDLMACTRKE